MSAPATVGTNPDLLWSDRKAELEPLGAALRRVSALATEESRRVEAAACGDDCEECGPHEDDR